MSLHTLSRKLRPIRLLALDVDGVLSDGTLYFTSDNQEMKTFSILDGLGIKWLMNSGIEVAIITGRISNMVSKRCQDLGIQHVTQGREDKLTALNELASSLGLGLGEIAYMGDDLPDLGAIVSAGVGFTVPNGHHFVRKHADYCTQANGGHGAVREVCELILEAQGKLDNILNSYLPDEH